MIFLSSRLPCVFDHERSNEWNAASSYEAVHLIEAWEPILPPFIRDNILDQLILPKLRKAVEEWNGRPSKSGKPRMLAGIVFPWLPLLGERAEEVLEAAKRRIRSVMRSWTVRSGVVEELTKWRKDVSIFWLTHYIFTEVFRSTRPKSGMNSCFAALCQNLAYAFVTNSS